MCLFVVVCFLVVVFVCCLFACVFCGVSVLFFVCFVRCVYALCCFTICIVCVFVHFFVSWDDFVCFLQNELFCLFLLLLVCVCGWMVFDCMLVVVMSRLLFGCSVRSFYGLVLCCLFALLLCVSKRIAIFVVCDCFVVCLLLCVICLLVCFCCCFCLFIGCSVRSFSFFKNMGWIVLCVVLVMLVVRDFLWFDDLGL